MDELNTVLEDNARLRAELRQAQEVLERVVKERDALSAANAKLSRMSAKLAGELERVTKERDEIAKLHYKEQTHRKAIERKREIDSVTRKMLVSQEELYDWLDVIGERVIEARAWAVYWKKKYETERRRRICSHAEKENARLRAELERVTKERDELWQAEHEEWFKTVLERNEARTEAVKWYRLCLEARKVAANLERWGHLPVGFESKRLISDGFGHFAFPWCIVCGREMQIIRPGDIQCERCGR